MARSGKIGIEYFSHDVDIMQDQKIKIIKAKHGLIGYAVYLRLLEELYRENGYYLQLSDDFNILFCDDNNLDYNVYILILNDCIEKGLFDSDTYENYTVLTSERIQRNYCEAIQRRKYVKFVSNYLLIDVNEHLPEKVNVNILDSDVDILPLNENIRTQSKVKESKVKETEKETNQLSLKNEKPKKQKNTYSENFEKLWEIYPVKKGKLSAYKIHQKLEKTGQVSNNRLYSAIEQQKRYNWRQTEKQFIPHFSTWLNKGMWDDEIDKPKNRFEKAPPGGFINNE